MLRNRRSSKGFSLLEVVMAMGAFTIIIMGVMQITTQGSKSYRGMKAIQTNLETAQFALNLMAKELRTSSVVSSSTGGTVSSIVFFDYSQNRCIQYRADESTGMVMKRSHSFVSANPDTNRSDCEGYVFAEPYETLLSGLSNQVVIVDPSEAVPDPAVGRVTVSLTIGTAGAAATAQTTVSLRDFNYIGI